MKRMVGLIGALLIVELASLSRGTQAADASGRSSVPTVNKSADAAAAAYDRMMQQRARRKEAETRLQQTLASPPQGAPPWMKRAAAAKNQNAVKTEAP